MKTIDDILEMIAQGKLYNQIKGDIWEWSRNSILEEIEDEKKFNENIETFLPPNTEREDYAWGKKLYYIFPKTGWKLSKKVEDEKIWELIIASARRKSSGSELEKGIYCYVTGRNVLDRDGMRFVITDKDSNQTNYVLLWKSKDIGEIINKINDDDKKEEGHLHELVNTLNEINGYLVENDTKKAKESILKILKTDSEVEKDSLFGKYDKTNPVKKSNIENNDVEEMKKALFRYGFYSMAKFYYGSNDTFKNILAIDQFIEHLTGTESVEKSRKAPPKYKFNSGGGGNIKVDVTIQNFVYTDESRIEAMIINTPALGISNDVNANNLLKHISNSATEDISNSTIWTKKDRLDYSLFDNVGTNHLVEGRVLYFYDNRKDEDGKEYGHTIVVKKRNVITMMTEKGMFEDDKNKLKGDNRDLFLGRALPLLETILSDEKFESSDERGSSWGESWKHRVYASETASETIVLDINNNVEYNKREKEIGQRLNLEYGPHKESEKRYWNEEGTAKKNGYEECRVYIVDEKGREVEVQLVTPFNFWNNKYGEAAHLEYKGGELSLKKKFVEHSLRTHHGDLLKKLESRDSRVRRAAENKLENRKEIIKKNLDAFEAEHLKIMEDIYLRPGGTIEELIEDFKENPNQNYEDYVLAVKLTSKLYHEMQKAYEIRSNNIMETDVGRKLKDFEETFKEQGLSEEETKKKIEATRKIIKRDEIKYHKLRMNENRILIKNKLGWDRLMYDVLPILFQTGEYETNHNPALRCIESIISQDFWSDDNIKKAQEWAIDEFLMPIITDLSKKRLLGQKEGAYAEIIGTTKKFIMSLGIRTGSKNLSNLYNNKYKLLGPEIAKAYLRDGPETAMDNANIALKLYHDFAKGKVATVEETENLNIVEYAKAKTYFSEMQKCYEEARRNMEEGKQENVDKKIFTGGLGFMYYQNLYKKIKKIKFEEGELGLMQEWNTQLSGLKEKVDKRCKKYYKEIYQGGKISALEKDEIKNNIIGITPHIDESNDAYEVSIKNIRKNC